MGNIYDEQGRIIGYTGGGPGCLTSTGVLIMIFAALGLCGLIYYFTKSLALLFIAVVAVCFLAYSIGKNYNASEKFFGLAKVVALVVLVLGGLYLLFLLIDIDMR